MIDASSSSSLNAGAGFIPIGNSSSPFFGNYDGQDFSIQNLTIDRAANQQGLFGFCINASISNVSMVNVDISGINYVGGIVGQSQNGLTLKNFSVHGSVSGVQDIGGIAGYLGSSSMINCSMAGTISGDNKVGGCLATATNTTIRNCSSAGTISRLSQDNNKNNWGGIVAFASNSSDISKCTSLANVEGNRYSGGIIGYLSSSVTVDSCYASGDVSGGTYVGGLIGQASGSAYVRNCYATGDITSYDQNAGGFAGSIAGTSSVNVEISNCYASGDAEAIAYASGFIGYCTSLDIDNCYSIGEVTVTPGAPKSGFASGSGSYTCDNSFWDTTHSNISTSIIGIGQTSEEMKTLTTFTNATWDFVGEAINGNEDHWSMDAGKNSGYPYLTWAEDLVPVTIVCPHTIVFDPEDGETNIDLEEGSIVWQGLTAPPFHQTRYEVTVKNPDEVIVYEVDTSDIGISLENAELVYSTKYTYTIMAYFLADDNSRIYPETDPYIYTFYTSAGIVVDPEEVNENNPVSYVIIDSPSASIPSIPVILDNPPTTGYPYQAIAAFSYNFDAEGEYTIQLVSTNYLEVTHVYVGGQEMDPYDGSSSLDIWAPVDGIIFIIFYYDGAKGDQNIVLTNDDATLPVELSSFNAIATADNFAQISWETASESNLLGYNIYRNEADISETAQRVNANIIAANNYATGSSYSFVDSEIERETTYYYWLESLELSNENKLYGPVSVRIETEENNNVLPSATSLFAAYPNPFNPETTIKFNVKENDMASLIIYNVKGQVVKSYMNFLPGEHSLVWNGKDNSNNNVASGVYLYKLISNCYTKTNKMILMK
ncbi:T9SS type A sorting domain-containing protein [bacterium]|nr:T9SS type A sorting domain-containing protein [bacterium]